MSSNKNFEKDSYKVFIDSSKKGDRKSRSSSKKKQENNNRGNNNTKSVSVNKENGLVNNLVNNGQNLPNNININVNNLIINNNSSGNMNLYPNNYGVYLSNSSVFSKLGSDIINSKANIVAMNNYSKRYQHQNYGTGKDNENVNSGVKINFNSLNNLLGTNNNANLNNLAITNNGYKEKSLMNTGTYTGSKNQLGFQESSKNSINQKYSNTIGKSNMMDNVINNLLENPGNNKKVNMQSNPHYNYHQNFQGSNNSINMPYNVNTQTSNQIESRINEIKVNSSTNLSNSINSNVNKSNSSLNLNDQVNNSESSGKNNSNENAIVLAVSDEIIERHSVFWEIMIDLEISIDQKQAMTVIEKKLISLLSDEILKNNLNFDIFSNSHLNKSYCKLFKIIIIMIIYLKFILLDFNYETNLKSNVKKIMMSLNEILINILDNFILIKDSTIGNNIMEKLSKEFIDKYNKIIKTHKVKKNKEQLNGNAIFKSLEFPINTIKQFSNNFFKIGYFKPIHTICLDLFRLIDSYTITNTMDLVMRNILFYVLNMANNATNEKKTGSISTKQLVFSPTSLLGYGFVGGVNNGINNITPPFLPSVSPEIYTLVLDLDETLVHFFFTPSGGSFLIRPGAFEFLQAMSEIYEIVIFTAAMKDYADNILDILDKDKSQIKYKLYRHHTSISGMSFVKDLSKIGRDLSKVIIIDNLPENFKLQQNNGLFIKTWNDDMKDTQLFDLSKLLKDLFLLRVPDVRIVIKKIKDEVSKRMKKNAMNPYANIDISKFL